MPSDKSASVVEMRNVVYSGEKPRTAFLDWLEAIKVRIVNYPAGNSLLMLKQTMRMMREATFSPDLDLSVQRALETEIAPHLTLDAEVPKFTFQVSGISRIITHQMVRTRIGVTFAQKCTGDADVRHDDVLVPRSLNRAENGKALNQYIGMHLGFKDWYAHEMDRKRVPLLSLRYMMPHSLSQYIYQDISLLALIQLYKNRMCTFQPIEWQTICAGYKSELERVGLKEFADLLKHDCPRCHWGRSGNNSPYIGRIYWPDAIHDLEPWNPESFLYGATAADMNDGPVFEMRKYTGWQREL